MEEDVFRNGNPIEGILCIVSMFQICTDDTATTLKAGGTVAHQVHLVLSYNPNEFRWYIINHRYIQVELFPASNVELLKEQKDVDLELKNSFN